MNFLFVLIGIVVLVGLLIWLTIKQDSKLTTEERKKQHSSYSSANLKKEKENTELRKVPPILSFLGGMFVIIFALIYLIKQSSNEKSFSFIEWFYIFLSIIIIFPVVGAVINFIKNIMSEVNPSASNKKYKSNINNKYPQTSFDQFIAGRMSLAKCFWLYYIFIGIIISIISGYFFELGHPIIIVIPIAYYVLISVSLWNCATLYTNEKLFNKQPYGWAIGVKIIIVLNIIATVSQIGSILLNK